MSKKRYMELLLEQIRNKRAKELVAREINSHIEDQEEAYLSQGLSAYDAERRAVLDMGDPVETGVSLDAIHRPKMSWRMVILTTIISALGILMLGIMCKGTSNFTTTALLKKQVIYLIIGFGIMLFICKIDYSRIFQRSGILALIYLGFLILQDTGFPSLFQYRNDFPSAQHPCFLWIIIQVPKAKLVSSTDSCRIYACIYPVDALPLVICIL